MRIFGRLKQDLPNSLTSQLPGSVIQICQYNWERTSNPRPRFILKRGLLAISLALCFIAKAPAQISLEPDCSIGVPDGHINPSIALTPWITPESSCNHPNESTQMNCLNGANSGPRFRLTEFNIYPTFSFLADQVGNYTEFEFASHTDLGRFELENRTVLNVADLPGTIKLGPTNPGNEPTTADVRGNGFGDILSGFFFSRKNKHRDSHLGLGPVITFPTASNEILGSGQWTIGPGAHYTKHLGRLSTGFFVWQSWGLTNDPSKKRINQLFGKPYLIYSLSEKWNLIYIPLGLSHSWKSPSGDDWTVPIGGGLRRLFEIHGQKMGIQVQAFDYVARKPKDPEWELRFTIEYLFGK